MHFMRVDGRLLPNYIGKPVVLLGKLSKKSADGQSIKITTTDGLLVNSTFPTPVDGNIDGYIEIRGTVQSKSTLLSESYTCFSTELAKDFDIDHYGYMIQVYNQRGAHIWETWKAAD